jgi:hypothetical protein
MRFVENDLFLCQFKLHNVFFSVQSERGGTELTNFARTRSELFG